MHQNPIHSRLILRPIRRPFPAMAALVALCLALSGCSNVSQSKYNPFNWFKSSAEDGPVVLYAPPQDQRLLVAQVLTLKVEQAPDGAIVRATGLPPTQGWWKAALVKADQDDDSRLVFEFRLFPPLTPEPASTQRSREITVAVSLTTRQLQGITTITVQGESNALSSRR